MKTKNAQKRCEFDLRPRPMILKFNRTLELVGVHVHENILQAKYNGTQVTALTEKQRNRERNLTTDNTETILPSRRFRRLSQSQRYGTL